MIKHAKIIMLICGLILCFTACSLSLAASDVKAAPTEESNRLRKQAELLIQDLKYKEAVSKFEDSYDIIQNDDFALEVYGSTEGHIFHNYDKAESLLKRAIELNPKASSHYASLGFIYEEQGKYKNAVKVYSKALKNIEMPKEGMWNGELSYIYQFLGSCYLKLNNEEKALMNLENAIKYNPYNIDANAALHRLYVEKQEYGNAYQIWKTDNYIDEEEKNPYSQLLRWNDMYKTMLPENGTEPSHFKLAELYSGMALHDEAKIEYVRALKENHSNTEIKSKISEIDVYTAFRDQLQRLLEKHYRSRCIDGVKADAQFYKNIEPAYTEIAKLFPDLSVKAGSTQVWINKLNQEIEKKFNVRVQVKNVTDNKMGIHFGRVIDVSEVHPEIFGRKADLRTVALKNMVSNGLDNWRSGNAGGVGGWGGSKTEVVRVIQNRESLGIISYALMYNKDYWDKIQKSAAEYDKGLNIDGKAPLDLYYSSVLSNEMYKRQIEIDMAKLKGKNMSEEDIYRYLFLNSENKVLIESTINLHESQHAIDNIHGLEIKWLGENEYRPMLAQLAYSEMSFLDLASFYTPYINSDIQEPHIQANIRIFENMVQYIHDNPSKYPEIDTSKNILSQITKLDEGDIREIAFEMFYKDYEEQRGKYVE